MWSIYMFVIKLCAKCLYIKIEHQFRDEISAFSFILSAIKFTHSLTKFEFYTFLDVFVMFVSHRLTEFKYSR